jgi:hypothetical protein
MPHSSVSTHAGCTAFDYISVNSRKIENIVILKQELGAWLFDEKKTRGLKPHGTISLTQDKALNYIYYGYNTGITKSCQSRIKLNFYKSAGTQIKKCSIGKQTISLCTVPYVPAGTYYLLCWAREP